MIEVESEGGFVMVAAAAGTLSGWKLGWKFWRRNQERSMDDQFLVECSIEKTVIRRMTVVDIQKLRSGK